MVLLRVPVEEGSAEFVEVEVDYDDLAEGVRLASRDPADTARAAFSLSSAFDRVLPALRTIVTRLRTADHAPDEIAMELGLKIGGEQGLIFTKGTAEATFTLSLTWYKPGSPVDRGA
ncbi:MAG TPA: CU044_2847 family protein [Pilimelia sp.]|nr:CU044_2847 family protein [Pilimelia sp.]